MAEQFCRYPQHQFVTTMTPVRISFAGGGTDLREYYERDFGAVLSTTIDQYVYVTVKRHGGIFQQAYRLNYAETEIVHSLDEIRNDIMRECLRLVPVEPPLYVSTVGDLPAYSGLGSSSSFAVGLLRALHVMRREPVGQAQVMEEAAHIEIDILKNPIGKQDHAAAAFGGFNYIRFLANGSVGIEPINLSHHNLQTLFQHMQLYWTGISRKSSEVLSEQKQCMDDNLDSLDQMRDQARELHDMLRTDRLDVGAFGRKLDEGWRMKRSLASKVSNQTIDDWYEKAMACGALGGKICGAGGGGFLMLLVAPDRQERIREALKDLQEVPIRFEAHGSRTLLTHFE
ncbi:MAG: hypothetical protein H7838_06005 [Magnetococcus sp. DMHC-8]